jgi:hypothetical protein
MAGWYNTALIRPALPREAITRARDWREVWRVALELFGVGAEESAGSAHGWRTLFLAKSRVKEFVLKKVVCLSNAGEPRLRCGEWGLNLRMLCGEKPTYMTGRIGRCFAGTALGSLRNWPRFAIARGGCGGDWRRWDWSPAAKRLC